MEGQNDELVRVRAHRFVDRHRQRELERAVGVAALAEELVGDVLAVGQDDVLRGDAARVGTRQHREGLADLVGDPRAQQVGGRGGGDHERQQPEHQAAEDRGEREDPAQPVAFELVVQPDVEEMLNLKNIAK